jgi:membrane protein YqaA with SNARE-associated domain
MKGLLEWVQSTAVAIGGPGIFIIAFLDSSFLSFPEVVDLLVVTVAVRQPYRMVYYAAMATAGSVLGCLALYYVGRRGGRAMLNSRFGSDRLRRGTELFERYGIWAVIVPSLLPPPAPFKLFVLLAGVSGLKPVRFTLAVLVGRAIRYFGVGILALWYGRQTLEFLHQHGRAVAFTSLALVAAGIAWAVWRRRRAHAL